jgi:hypothetical protein
MTLFLFSVPKTNNFISTNLFIIDSFDFAKYNVVKAALVVHICGCHIFFRNNLA